MTRAILLFGGALLLTGLVTGATIAQRRVVLPEEETVNEMRLAPGETVLLHDSGDTVVEIFVDQTTVKTERIQYQDSADGTKHPLANGAWFRAQGRVILSRGEATSNIDIRVRWRYADTIFRTHSRGER